jgi:hypothetical protein
MKNISILVHIVDKTNVQNTHWNVLVKMGKINDTMYVLKIRKTWPT